MTFYKFVIFSTYIFISLRQACDTQAQQHKLNLRMHLSLSLSNTAFQNPRLDMSEILSNTHKHTQKKLKCKWGETRKWPKKRRKTKKFGGLNLQYKYFLGRGFLPSIQGERRLRERSFQKYRVRQTSIL